MPVLTGKRIKEVYVLNRKLVPENIDLDDKKEYDIMISSKNIFTINDGETFDLVYFCKFKAKKKVDDSLESKNLNNWENE